MSSADDTMAQYRSARTEYVALLKKVYAENDPAKRAGIVASLRSQNRKLVDIAQTLLDTWSTLNSSPTSNQTLSDLRQDLVRYRQDLEIMKGYKDETKKLNMIYEDTTGDVSSTRITYLVYVVIILFLLIAVFAMFVLRGISGTVSSVFGGLPEPSTGLLGSNGGI